MNHWLPCDKPKPVLVRYSLRLVQATKFRRHLAIVASTGASSRFYGGDPKSTERQ